MYHAHTRAGYDCRSAEKLCETGKKTVILFGKKEAEAEKISVQPRKIGAVPDHHSLSYGGFKQNMGVYTLFQAAAEDEIGEAGIGFDGKAGERLPDALPLGGNQGTRFFYIYCIREQELSCQISKGADGPGILAGKDSFPERFI